MFNQTTLVVNIIKTYQKVNPFIQLFLIYFYYITSLPVIYDIKKLHSRNGNAVYKSHNDFFQRYAAHLGSFSKTSL